MSKPQRVDEVFVQVRAFLADVLGIPPASITFQARIYEDLRVDSLDLLELAAFAEHRWKITISEPDLPGIQTVEDACVLISRMATARDQAADGKPAEGAA
jgi:acyl carrier protein